MEGYLYKEGIEYLHDLNAYRNIVDDNSKWNEEPASHYVFNINIDNDSW